MTAAMTGWRARAACRAIDPDLFFPVGDLASPANHLQAEKAKQVCSSCEVRLNCLAFAVDAAEGWGIWGGATEAERAAVRPHLTRGTA
jgi:WhiB family transcriptional regulator, redox-sensing transcriptional regulator